jgi:hypothetical protein
MAQYLVLKVSAGDIPALGTTGSADVYRGDHATLEEAMTAAATAWRLGPGVRMWATLASNLTRHVTATTTAVG